MTYNEIFKFKDRKDNATDQDEQKTKRKKARFPY